MKSVVMRERRRLDQRKSESERERHLLLLSLSHRNDRHPSKCYLTFGICLLARSLFLSRALSLYLLMTHLVQGKWAYLSLNRRGRVGRELKREKPDKPFPPASAFPLKLASRVTVFANPSKDAISTLATSLCFPLVCTEAQAKVWSD